MVSRLSMARVEGMGRGEFVGVFGGVFEHSAWVAERTWGRRPFGSVEGLHRVMVDEVARATEEEKLGLIRAHPDLVGRLAREGRVTVESTREQAAAGLAGLSADEVARFEDYNARYWKAFGFPFIICARENKKEAILRAFPVRLANGRDEEIGAALGEIGKIARYRLLDKVEDSSGESAMSFKLVQHAYGKSRVRLTQVARLADRHELKELDVAVRLEGAFEGAYLAGDNRNCIATDSMKNTVYVLAAEGPIESIERFALKLAGHFVEKYAQVSAVTVEIRQALWNRVVGGSGEVHPHAFVSAGEEERVCAVRQDRSGVRVTAGIEGLVVLKTTGSAWENFVRDEFTTLPDAADRLMGTSVMATWTYPSGEGAWNENYAAVRGALIGAFANHKSRGVQETLFAMGRAALAACAAAGEISLRLPNQHRIPFNLVPFGKENRNEVFVATDEPFGLIEGTVRRE